MSLTFLSFGSEARQKLTVVVLPSPGESVVCGLSHPFTLSSFAGMENADVHLLGGRFTLKIIRATPALAPVISSLRSWSPFP